MESPLVMNTVGQLRDMLAARQMSGDGRLPREVDIAANLGVSRPVLRRALEILKEEGLIESRRGSGTFVKRAGPLPPAGYTRPQTIMDIEDCLHFRAVVESAAAEEAALKGDLKGIAAIEAAVEALAHLPAEDNAVAEGDFAFHLAVAHATGNKYYPMTLEFLKPHISLGLQLGRQLRSAPPNITSRRVMKEHREIFAAIQSGNGALAREQMSRHLAAGIERIFGKRSW
ncbi:FadR/GntR family transcriptional regulator [Tropicimonas sp.]|uniref:FadR/GntR family transcriptional regulator n=1 Tax=Tropicimonas sp. TaxID=2067044 RepID=UPI003A871494